MESSYQRGSTRQRSWPHLFLIYINDIVDNLNCNAYLFADDMKLFNGITQDADIARLQSDICAIDTWTDHWLLKFNAEKCSQQM